MTSLAMAWRKVGRIIEKAGIRREDYETREDFEAAIDAAIKADAEEREAQRNEIGEIWL